MGNSFIHHAAEEGKLFRVKLLIGRCNLNLKDSYGRTPVMSAAAHNKKKVVDLLIQRGAQVNCADDWKSTLLHEVSRMGWVDVVERIVESGGTDVNAADIFGETPLMAAAKGGRKDVAALLIRAGADVHRICARKKTALHLASERGRAEVVQVLLEQEGLDLNPQDEDGQTPLLACHCWRGRGVVKQLLVAGADPNIKDKDGYTALRVRINNCDPETIRLLVKYGAFFEDSDYARISKRPFLKDNILKDVDLCTQSIVNKFHRQSLPALYSNPHFAKKLACIEKLKLKAHHIQDVEKYVKCDMQANAFCNITKAPPFVLSVLCVESLIAGQPGIKRSASPESTLRDLKYDYYKEVGGRIFVLTPQTYTCLLFSDGQGRVEPCEINPIKLSLDC